MQLSIFTAQEALEQLFDSWLSLQNRCTRSENSNSYLKLADHLKANPCSELQVLCVHDGSPARELHALCVIETHRAWAASKHTLANWIAEPGLESTPLAAEDQRYSALSAMLRELASMQSSKKLALRHLSPQHPTTFALQAICKQQGLESKEINERNQSLREIQIPLNQSTQWVIPTQDKMNFSSLKSLP